MALSSKLKIMISSRCEDKFPNNDTGKKLSEIRKELKTEIEAETIFGLSAFEVWINETTPPQGGTWDSWEVCMEAVKDCDILICLYNGHAGKTLVSSEIAICHAEMSSGLDQAPGKVHLVDMGNIATAETDEQKKSNDRFQKYVKDQTLFRGSEVTTIDELKERAKETIHSAVINLALAGVREQSKGKYHSGESLNWSRMSYKERQTAMVDVMKDAITGRPDSFLKGDHLFSTLDGVEVLFIPNAIPDAISISQAKEMVGQPFLKDHQYADKLGGSQGGPVHIIACHKGATETQAKKLLGFPDATVVTAPFGIFVADNIQKVQFIFIANCRNETSTRNGVQRYFEWMKQNGEDQLLVRRALSRAKIIQTVAGELTE
jgi:hypothetical protein